MSVWADIFIDPEKQKSLQRERERQRENQRLINMIQDDYEVVPTLNKQNNINSSCIRYYGKNIPLNITNRGNKNIKDCSIDCSQRKSLCSGFYVSNNNCIHYNINVKDKNQIKSQPVNTSTYGCFRKK